MVKQVDSAFGKHDWKKILGESTATFDGGFVAGGLCGNGDAFVVRDKNGIRPCFYYIDDEVIVAASERPAIMTAFKVPIESIHELPKGHALIVNADGEYAVEQILEENVSDKFTISEKLWDGHIKRKKTNQKKGHGFGYKLVNNKSPYTNTLSARYYKDGSEILVKQKNANPVTDLT
jgi:hypothetical protein